MATKEEALKRLSSSPFRMRFHLSGKDVAYIDEKGLDIIRKHAEDFIHTRIAPEYIPNDGKQTPMRGHPVFVAQHACAVCCRGCLEKWYHVPKNTALRKDQEERLVDLLMYWIEKEYNKKKSLEDIIPQGPQSAK